VNGKHTIVGAVSEGLNVASFPGQIRVAVYLEMALSNVGDHRFYIRLSYSKVDPVVIQVDLHIEKENTVAGMGVPSFNLPVIAPGWIVLEISEDEQKWRRVLRRPVRVGAIPFPNVLPPPDAQ
jgi:hypothetical protein